MANKHAVIDAAIAATNTAELNHKKMTVSLHPPNGRPLLLVKGTGEVTPFGEYYYGQLGVAPPTIYPYEQRLSNGKWLEGFDKKMHLMVCNNGEVLSLIHI